jgi:phosphoribosylaminoimidazole carboxylase
MVYKIGIIGGGQLGLMLLETIQELNKPKNVQYRYLVYDPSFDCPCAKLDFIDFYQGDFQDEQRLEDFCRMCNVVTFEIENINCEPLLKLEESEEVVFYPSPKVLTLIQNKYYQKSFFQDNNINTVPFKTVLTLEDVRHEFDNVNGISRGDDKCVLKHFTAGYDGKGVKVIFKDEVERFDETTSFAISSNSLGVLLEKYIEDKKEISVCIARDYNGSVMSWPSVEMHFSDEHNILELLRCPSTISSELEEKVQDIAKRVVEQMNGIGVFAIEMFVTSDEEIYINEIAPRPHNSAHHTREASTVSVYAALSTMLLGSVLFDGEAAQCSTIKTSPCAMINILGPDEYEGLYELDKIDIPYCYITDYRKTISRPQRKLGHVTIIGDDAEYEFYSMYKGSTMACAKHIVVSDVRYMTDGIVIRVETPMVGVVMGSTSDWPTMKAACEILDSFGIRYEKLVVSAHRTPERLREYALKAESRYVGVIIAGAGGAAHLPGMLASMTHIPIIGVPVKTSTLSGVDSLHSIVQMPGGVPVACVAIGGAKNAGILAAQMLGIHDKNISIRLKEYKKNMERDVIFSSNKL